MSKCLILTLVSVFLLTSYSHAEKKNENSLEDILAIKKEEQNKIKAEIEEIEKTIKGDVYWDKVLSLGFNFNKGTHDNLLLNAKFSIDGKVNDNLFKLSAEQSYGESNEDKNVDFTILNLSYQRVLKDKIAFGILGDYFRDDLLDLDYRIKVGPTFSYFWIKSDKVKIETYFGVLYLWESERDQKDSYVSPVIGIKEEFRINDTFSLFDKVSYNFSIDDTDDYFIEAEVGANINLSKKLSLTLSVKDIYDNTPAEGNDSNNLYLSTYLNVTLQERNREFYKL